MKMKMKKSPAMKMDGPKAPFKRKKKYFVGVAKKSKKA